MLQQFLVLFMVCFGIFLWGGGEGSVETLFQFPILVEIVMTIDPTLKVLVGIIYNLSEILYPMFLADMPNTFY